MINGGSFRVGFLVAGTQKGGTTTLDASLRGHPEVCMADQKEVHFFDNEEAFAGGRPDPAALYHPHFSPRKQHRIAGESTPIYMYWRPAPERIQAYNQDMRFILLLRNPIQRAFSHWNMAPRRNAECRPFLDAIQEEIRDRERGKTRQHKVFSYCDRGFYSEQIERLWSLFPQRQTLVLKSERFWNAPEEAMTAICDFLGVARIEPANAEKLHAFPYARDLSAAEKSLLRSLFEPEVRRLECLLGWDCSDWLSG